MCRWHIFLTLRGFDHPALRAGWPNQGAPTKSYRRTWRYGGNFWWERVDSNHRSRRQQIYSLPPLATRERSHIYLLALLTEKEVELVDGLEPPTC